MYMLRVWLALGQNKRAKENDQSILIQPVFFFTFYNNMALGQKNGQHNDQSTSRKTTNTQPRRSLPLLVRAPLSPKPETHPKTYTSSRPASATTNPTRPDPPSLQKNAVPKTNKAPQPIHLVHQPLHPQLAGASSPQPPLPDFLLPRFRGGRRQNPAPPPLLLLRALRVEPRRAAGGGCHRRHAEVHEAAVACCDGQEPSSALQASVREVSHRREVHLCVWEQVRQACFVREVGGVVGFASSRAHLNGKARQGSNRRCTVCAICI